MERDNKLKLHKRCLEVIEEKISYIQTEIKSIEESRNNETKSSAGDKYETSREMMSIELDKNRAQLSKTNELRLLLQNINPEEKSEEIKLGSLVVCSQGKYYMTVPLGKIESQEENYFCISMISPLGKQLRGKKAGDTILLGERKIEIHTVL